MWFPCLCDPHTPHARLPPRLPVWIFSFKSTHWFADKVPILSSRLLFNAHRTVINLKMAHLPLFCFFSLCLEPCARVHSLAAWFAHWWLHNFIRKWTEISKVCLEHIVQSSPLWTKNQGNIGGVGESSYSFIYMMFPIKGDSARTGFVQQVPQLAVSNANVRKFPRIPITLTKDVFHVCAAFLFFTSRDWNRKPNTYYLLTLTNLYFIFIILCDE